MSSVLVIFGKDFPKKSKKWFGRFDKVLIREESEEFIGPGSVQEAYKLVNEVSRLTFRNGSRLSGTINWRGYELWWINYENIFIDFCLPYTQYRKLLEYLKDFDEACLFDAPNPNLFRYFLRAHGRQCRILNKFRLSGLLPIPAGVLIQLALSILLLPWLKISGANLMVWASDKFSSPHDYDFRMKYIYEELRGRKIPFVEFIRSMERWNTVLSHAWRRKRPVFYSDAVISVIYRLAKLFKEKKEYPQDFWLSVGTHYLQDLKGAVWSVRIMEFILRFLGIKAAIIPAACSRTFHEVLACKLAGVGTVGIQHAVITQYAFISDFMPEFTGPKKISVDKYGIWSEHLREYYISHGRAYLPEQLHVSGPMRPLILKQAEKLSPNYGEKLRVLFVLEQLADPTEVMPYIKALLEQKDFDLHFKFRPYRDGFELWLKDNRLDIYDKIIKETKVLRRTMEEAITICDVTVGSHSTAVLESLLRLKPFVFFHTEKWGDYFDIKPLDGKKQFFANTPQELTELIKKSGGISKETLKELQERFFGDPYKNGSKWVVEQALEFARNYGKQ